jgi:hypothetical protein
MYGISPEDRLWLVKSDLQQRRHEAEAARMVATAGREDHAPAATRTPGTAPHPRRAWLGQVLGGLGLGRRHPHQGVAH